MSTRVAINGLGRIGRAILKLVIDEPALELVAVNDLVDVENLAYLLRFDTVYGRYAKPVVVDGGDLVVAGRKAAHAEEPRPSGAALEGAGRRAGVRVHRGVHAARGSREAHPRRSAVRPPVGAVEGRRGGDRRPRRERARRRAQHHLLRELHDELHHADRRGHRPAHRVQEGGDDDRARLHRFPVDRRRAEQAPPPRPRGRRRTSCRPRRVPRSRRRARCRSTRAGSTGSRCGRRFPSARSPTSRSSPRGTTSVDEVNQVLAEEAGDRALRGGARRIARPAGLVGHHRRSARLGRRSRAHQGHRR